MKLYTIKSAREEASYCSVLQETERGYILRICIDRAGYQKISEEFIEKELEVPVKLVSNGPGRDDIIYR